MSNLKDTDIDDLFRRASDKYPLRTNSTDWDKMAAALDQEPAPAGIDDTVDKRRKRRFLSLLLFLPLAGASYFTWVHTGHGSSHPAVAVATGPADQKSMGGPENNHQKTGQVDPAGIKGAEGQPAGGNPTDGQATSGQATGGHGTASNAARRDGQENATSPTNVTAGGKRFAAIMLDRNTSKGGVMGSKTRKGGSTTPTYIEAQPLTLEWAGDMQRARIANDYQLSVVVTAPPVAKNTDPAKPKKPKTSYLYAGILGAPDISTVKMQSVKGVGATFGVLVGYAFNPRWSIETGAYVDRKSYYTEGEYFDKSVLPIYGSSKLLNVDGTCYMWEIPLNVRYTFNPDAKTKWFATAGLSTYLMSKEKYNYTYEQGTWYGQKTWNNNKPSQYPFSIVNLSGGFEQRLGKVGNLRVEPYMRLPLQGIGTGKLPIMSAGVNIGITRRLW